MRGRGAQCGGGGPLPSAGESQGSREALPVVGALLPKSGDDAIPRHLSTNCHRLRHHGLGRTGGLNGFGRHGPFPSVISHIKYQLFPKTISFQNLSWVAALVAKHAAPASIEEVAVRIRMSKAPDIDRVLVHRRRLLARRCWWLRVIRPEAVELTY